MAQVETHARTDGEENRVAPAVAQVETHARTEELSVDAVSRLLTKARNTDRFKAAVDFFPQICKEWETVTRGSGAQNSSYR